MIAALSAPTAATPTPNINGLSLLFDHLIHGHALTVDGWVYRVAADEDGGVPTVIVRCRPRREGGHRWERFGSGMGDLVRLRDQILASSDSFKTLQQITRERSNRLVPAV